MLRKTLGLMLLPERGTLASRRRGGRHGLRGTWGAGQAAESTASPWLNHADVKTCRVVSILLE